MTQRVHEQENTMSRIHVRVPLFIREIIDRAAAMQGSTPTNFLIGAALEKAERIIETHSIIRLTQRDQELLATTLAQGKTVAPTRHVMDALKQHPSRKCGASR